MEINPRINGIHSLAEALKSFYEYHANPENIFALKDTILRSHHALETLFKHILWQVNPVLLLSEETKIEKVVNGYEKVVNGEIVTILDESWTINLEDTIKRLQLLGYLKGLKDEEYAIFIDSIRKLSNYRNRLQHLGLSANPDIIGRILGNLLPRAIDVLEETFVSLPFPFSRTSIKEDIKDIYPESLKIISILRHDYDLLIKDAIKFFKGHIFENQNLKITIKSYGEVGAPPYYPEIKLEGFLNCEYDIRRLFTSYRKEQYWAEVKLRQ